MQSIPAVRALSCCLPLQDFVANIADLCPEYCVGTVIMDLLQSDAAEAQLIALRGLHLVATSVPQDTAASLGLQASTVRKSSTFAVGSSTSSSVAGSSTGNKRMVKVSRWEAHHLNMHREHCPGQLKAPYAVARSCSISTAIRSCQSAFRPCWKGLVLQELKPGCTAAVARVACVLS